MAYREASAQDERILTQKSRLGDASFDARPVRGATLDDLDLARLQYLYLPRAFDEEVLARNDRTVEKRLAATKMIAGVDQPVPTDRETGRTIRRRRCRIVR